ncbi:MAG TPA: hypothetical protein VM802_04970 [Chitinophaga sp.]|uniref:hypothetical protein n=1 Tax=Chitinophaga sp. TaxID=1869181 RepID=UPI002C4334C1|nr:hypothetical protein [Chitinophaga sp.]HVI44193.1 hypothetical protein [Chitinophaga sp.]
MKILFRLFIKPFYRENAGAFLFLTTILFLIVSPVHGAGLVEYHYSLMTGMLSNYYFLLVVFFVWILYARKCAAFVTALLYRPEYTFLRVYNSASSARRFRLFLLVDTTLLLPVIIYAVLVTITGWRQRLFPSTLLVPLYVVALCAGMAAYHLQQLSSLERDTTKPLLRGAWSQWLRSRYPVMLLRYVLTNQKMIWLGIKLFTCWMLYGAARNNTATVYDPGTVFWFFNFGIIANGIILNKTREFETVYFSFYRNVPVSLVTRLLQYALFCLLLLLPEMITIASLTPVHLHDSDALRYALCSYSLVLLMLSVTFLRRFSMKSYLQIILLITCIQFGCLLTGALLPLSLLMLVTAVCCFSAGYYRYE